MNCDAQDGTIVRAHYSGIRQHQYGKGRGIKGHDLIAADLCYRCHQSFDSYANATTEIDRSEQFLHCVILTILADWREGLITIA